jgi:hypothetical protein
MYPNFDNKQDRSSKHQELLARIERDQRLEAGSLCECDMGK